MPARVACVATLILVAIGVAFPMGGAPGAAARKPPHVKHVFIIVLENENAGVTFGPGSRAPYLATRLPAKGSPVTGSRMTRSRSSSRPPARSFVSVSQAAAAPKRC